MKYTNTKSGSWTDSSIWNVYNAANDTWIQAASYPDSSDCEVLLSRLYTVTLNSNVSVFNLKLNNEQDVTRLLLNGSITIHNRLSLFSGNSETPGKFNSTTPPSIVVRLIDGSGSIIFSGNENREIIKNGEVIASRLLAGDWSMIIRFSPGKTAIINDRFRCGHLIVESGILDIPPLSNPFRVDGDGLKYPTSASGSITVKPGAILKARHLERGESVAMNSFIIEEGGELILNSSDARIASKVIVNNGTTTFAESHDQFFPVNGGYQYASLINEFNNIRIYGSGKKKLVNDVMIRGSIDFNGISQLDKNGHNINYSDNSKMNISIKPVII